MHQLFLASASPRRRELLERAGFPFTVFPLKVSEIPDKNLTVDQQILQIAGQKAKAAHEALSERETKPYVLLSADTEVVLNDELLGKPDSELAARQTLRRLSGRSHFVKTGMWMIDSSSGKTLTHLETTEVRFRQLSDDEIAKYVATGEPMDKAGSYGIQGLGRALIEEFRGDFDNVVGLPVTAFAKIVQQNGWKFQP